MQKASKQPQHNPWYKNINIWAWIITGLAIVATIIILSIEDAEEERAKAKENRPRSYEEIFTPEEQKQYDQKVEEDLEFIGYQLIDKTLGPIGEIVDINDLTENVLFIVEHEGEEIMIPAADDLILDIDDENETILMDLPQGLVNFDEAETDEE